MLCRRQKEKRINPNSPLAPLCSSPTELAPYGHPGMYSGTVSSHPDTGRYPTPRSLVPQFPTHYPNGLTSKMGDETTSLG